MKNRKELIKSKGYWVAKWQLQLFDELNKFKKDKGYNSTDLAKHLNVTKGYVSQILKGDFDHKISKLISLSLSVGKAPVLKFQDIETYIEKDGLGIANEDFNIVLDVKFGNEICKDPLVPTLA